MSYIAQVTGFTKLFSTIVHSTVWREEKHVKIVWITMLALADRKGQVQASVPGLADASKVTLDECIDALYRLGAPDKWSRTKENGGRRITEIAGGWQLLNYIKYRELRDEDSKRLGVRDRVRKHRERKRQTVTVTVSNTIAEAEAEAEADTSTSKTLCATEREFARIWAEYPNKLGKEKALRHFLSSVKTPDDLAAILVALERYRAHLSANSWKKPQNGATWFNNWREWVDWLEPATESPASAKTPAAPAVDMASLIDRGQSEREANPEAVWSQVVERMCRAMDTSEFLTTFAPTWQLARRGDTIDVAVPDKQHIDLLREEHAMRIQKAVDEIAGERLEVLLVPIGDLEER